MTHHLSRLVLLLGGIGLVGVNVSIATRLASSEPIASSASLAVPNHLESDSNVFAPPPALTLDEALERPLFSPERRPWKLLAAEAPPAVSGPPPSDPIPPPAVAPIELRLVGVQRGPVGAKALVRRPSEAAAMWIRSGDVLDGWTVVQVDDWAVRFSLSGETRTFELHPASPGHGP